MTQRDKLLAKIAELSKFLRDNGRLAWADRLDVLGARPEAQATLQQLRIDVRQLFGAMGSFTDIDIYHENDPRRTKAANARLNRLLDDLFESVNAEVT